MIGFPWKPVEQDKFNTAVQVVKDNPEHYSNYNHIHLAEVSRSNERNGFVYLQYQAGTNILLLAKVPVEEFDCTDPSSYEYGE